MYKTCRYKSCPTGGVLDARIEVKTVMPKKGVQAALQEEFLVSWKKNGEAEFHRECWEMLCSLSRCRKKAGINGVLMLKEEKVLVKTAEEAAEEFDSIETLKSEAKRAAEWIRTAKHLVVFTGAGISTSAGIGDYRGKDGKWTEEDQNSVNVDSVFTASTSQSDEPVSKKIKLDSLSDDRDEGEEEDDMEDGGVAYEKLRPTYTHEALHKLVVSGYLKYIISQNGDGLHGLSGIQADRISELHGNVFVEKCEKCGDRYDRKFYVMDDMGSQYFEEMEDYGKSDVKKPKFARKCDRCGLSHRTGRKCKKKKCGGYLMDTIINFRDLLEEDILSRARENAQQCDVMLCLGTTLQVTPACDLVKKMKNRNKLIICNRQGTPVDKQFVSSANGKVTRGSRVFGDCDPFMREVMGHMFPAEELRKWEAEREERLKLYEKQRD